MSRQITGCGSGDNEDYGILSSELSLIAKCSVKNNCYDMGQGTGEVPQKTHLLS